MTLSHFSTPDLKIMASEPVDSEMRKAARRELGRRGQTYEPRGDHDKAEMDSRMGLGRGTSAPCVRRDGRVQTFGGPPGRSKPAKHDKAQMDARMGLVTKKAAVRREGRDQIFETMTPDDAKRILAAKKDGSK